MRAERDRKACPSFYVPGVSRGRQDDAVDDDAAGEPG